MRIFLLKLKFLVLMGTKFLFTLANLAKPLGYRPHSFEPPFLRSVVMTERCFRSSGWRLLGCSRPTEELVGALKKPGASRMASKTPPFLVMCLETGLSETSPPFPLQNQSLPKSKHLKGRSGWRLGGRRVPWGSGVWVPPLAHDPWSKAFQPNGGKEQKYNHKIVDLLHPLWTFQPYSNIQPT